MEEEEEEEEEEVLLSRRSRASRRKNVFSEGQEDSLQVKQHVHCRGCAHRSATSQIQKLARPDVVLVLW